MKLSPFLVKKIGSQTHIPPNAGLAALFSTTGAWASALLQSTAIRGAEEMPVLIG